MLLVKVLYRKPWRHSESTNFEDAIRNTVSIDGDSDTIAAITGSVAGAYYGVPSELKQKILMWTIIKKVS